MSQGRENGPGIASTNASAMTQARGCCFFEFQNKYVRRMTRMQIARAQQVAAGYPNAQLFGVPMAEDEHQLYGGV